MDNPSGSQQHYSFALKRIQLVEKNLNVFHKRDNDSNNFDFDISVKITLDPEKELSIHFFSVIVKYKPDNRVLASTSIICIFDISNLRKIVSNENGKLELPQGLVNLLNTVVIGTMRGVMFSEFRGTALDTIIFPVLDPTRFERGNKR